MRDGEDPADLKAAFDHDGFVVLRDLIDRRDLAGYAAAVDQAVAVRKAADHRRLEEKSRYEQSFLQCQYIWEDFPEVRPLTFHPGVCAVAARLVGAGRLRLWHDQALYKEPGGLPTQAHQDHPYWPIAELRTVTAWIPFVEADEAAGCMGYVPGSHRDAPRYVDIFRGGEETGPTIADQARFVPVRPGDVIFHHGLTTHMAMGNRSNAMRRVYTAIYFADGCTRSVGEMRHPSVDRCGIAPSAPIDGAATPIAWPIDDYPTPEPWPQIDDERFRRGVQLGIIPNSP